MQLNKFIYLILSIYYFSGELNIAATECKEDSAKTTDIDNIINSKETRLMQAARSGNIDQVRTLLKAGAKINIKYQGKTALNIAASYGHYEIVNILIEYNADVNEQDNNGNTPLILTIKALADIKNKERFTIYQLKLETYESIIKALINAKANLNITVESDNITALDIAKAEKLNSIFEMLLDAGAEFQVRFH